MKPFRCKCGEAFIIPSAWVLFRCARCRRGWRWLDGLYQQCYPRWSRVAGVLNLSLDELPSK